MVHKSLVSSSSAVQDSTCTVLCFVQASLMVSEHQTLMTLNDSHQCLIFWIYHTELKVQEERLI